jgi:hypothetical protein
MSFSALPPTSSISSIQRLDVLSAIPEADLGHRYPALKLGVQSEVRFFGSRLADLAKAHIDSHSDIASWAITAPPFNAAPAAANMMSWVVFELIRDVVPGGKVELINLRTPHSPIRNAEDFATYYQYSNNSLEERIKERSRNLLAYDDILERKGDFFDRGVIVVNDIKVTGTQQRFMQDSFVKAGVRDMQWLYVFEVAAELGETDPQIEHRINTARLSTLEEFGSVLCGADIQFTARCISTLFACDLDSFRDLITRLPQKTRLRLLDLAEREGRYGGDFFIDKIHLLQHAASNEPH